MSSIKKVIKKAIKVSTGCEILYKTNWYKSMFRDLNHEYILIMCGIVTMMSETTTW